jgi:hypothetical protein
MCNLDDKRSMTSLSILLAAIHVECWVISRAPGDTRNVGDIFRLAICDAGFLREIGRCVRNGDVVQRSPALEIATTPIRHHRARQDAVDLHAIEDASVAEGLRPPRIAALTNVSAPVVLAATACSTLRGYARPERARPCRTGSGRNCRANIRPGRLRPGRTRRACTARPSSRASAATRTLAISR